jgi:hypothetical protein
MPEKQFEKPLCHMISSRFRANPLCQRAGIMRKANFRFETLNSLQTKI